MIVGIDSMVLIYAGLVPNKSDEADPKQIDFTNRAKLLLHMQRNNTVVLPTVAISEVLAPVPEASRGILIAKLASLFVCPSFDLPASAIAAHLWAEHKKFAESDQYGRKRHVLRADAMIIASAKVAGATEFYTNDKKCRKLAGIVMKGCELPTSDPTDMFATYDIARGEI